MFSIIRNKLVSLIQLIIVIIYIFFEELIWEGIAKPIYRYIHAFRILQKVEEQLHKMNAYVLLMVFVMLLIVVQSLGLYAGVLFVSGHIFLGLLFYLSKIPIAAFTFWIFRVTEDKLMQFRWFRWFYMKIMDLLEWFKTREIYIQIMQRLKHLKYRFKIMFRDMKIKYFNQESIFIKKIKYLYKTIKTILKK